MINFFKKKAYQSLFLLDPEVAHDLSILALKSGLTFTCSSNNDTRLNLTVAGINFPNPLGIAAGFDKNAEVPLQLLNLGFGFVEVGTLTPKPQYGNPRPRVFRLVKERAIINRLGFNNKGYDTAFLKLSKIKATSLIGINIGANKNSTDRIADYTLGIHRFYSVATYFTINISSPNTTDLRKLQERENLSKLLSSILKARHEEIEKTGKNIPIFLKISPDLTERELDDIAAEAIAYSIDGFIISNTTLSYDDLKNKVSSDTSGGLSGSPLFQKSTTVLAKMRKRVGPDMVIIGVGGISSAEDAIEKIKAGADLLQLYSAMIYEGPTLPQRILKALSLFLEKNKILHLREIRDSTTEYWSQKNL
ncbi:Dihydroorotate dehydrogenase [Liberibacter crescens BT-1]|uniref:Dihydroorotate dehydrogenase (quinone) n=1 Tax=Liberibacter crescens (strain BT-1) TaxID=1215343 RepID=L0EUT5_LIBCB|nr:quinone-dependent dihydroorotate dehydrogenase [Liberibacter crescens]AGA64141.1 Dihydroorotate dehydrogenase [Liberibacter crescens BT-1]AMC13298.1 diguanylate cyclase [Liberibacter crescens]